MNSLALLPNLAGPDMIIIFLIVLIMFGAKKLPELAKGLGQAVREFSKAKDDMNSELHRSVSVDAPAAHPSAYHHPAEHAVPAAQPAPVDPHAIPATLASHEAAPAAVSTAPAAAAQPAAPAAAAPVTSTPHA